MGATDGCPAIKHIHLFNHNDMAKLTLKEVQEILGIKAANLPDEQKQFINTLTGAFVDTINKALDDIPDTNALRDALKPLQSADGITLDSLSKENQELVKQVKSLTEALDKMKKRGIGLDFVNKFNERFDEMYDSPKFQDFINDREKSSGIFAFKDISMTGNYTGTNLITQQSDRVVSQVTDKKLHVRDFATVLPGDPEFPIFAFQQIEHVDRNARYVSENGMLPESSLKITEKTAQVSRVGHHFKLSKRALKCRTYLRGYVMNCLISGVRDAEDFQILFGDGTGDNLTGITRHKGVLPVESIISDSIFTVAAGGVSSLTKMTDGVMLELKEPNDLLIEGLKVVISGDSVTNTALVGTFDVIKANDRCIFLEGVTVTNDGDLAADAAKLTLTFKNGAYQSIELPNSIDALETAISVMTYAQFSPTVLVLNPITINAIRCEKATDGNRLEVVKDINGNPVIGGLRVVPYTGMPVGKYFLGDMQRGAQIIDYTPLTAEWADDVNTKLKNQVVLLAQAEEIVPVFCPWAFAYGSINALKTAIKKA